MAGSLNKVFLIGRLGNDPDIKSTQNGKSVAILVWLQVKAGKIKTQVKKEKTEWHRVVIFNEGLVNVVQKYLKKGAQVYVEGQISTTKYTDNNGQEKFSTQIVLQGCNSTLTMLGASNKATDSGIDQDTSSNLPSDENASKTKK